MTRDPAAPARLESLLAAAVDGGRTPRASAYPVPGSVTGPEPEALI